MAHADPPPYGVTRGRRRRRRMLGWGAAVLVLLLVAGGVTAYETGRLADWLGAQTPAPAADTAPGYTAPTAPTPGAVARPAPVRGGNAAAVRRALTTPLADPHLYDLRAVVAPLSGRPLLDVGRGTSMPASTMKLLTATAALETLGPDHTFATRVVVAGRHGVVLVGGGDPYLEGARPRAGDDDASLQVLAARTARALHAGGTRRVRLSYDDSLFSGPRVDPHWPATYVPDVVSPITALWADEGRDASGYGGVADPSAAAAALFATYLRKDGVTVDATVAHTTAPAGARELARVTSPPLADIVERVLQVSDNEGAEVLAHQVGLAVSGAGSFAGGVAGVTTTLSTLGIHLDGATIQDGSGLSRHDRLDGKTLVQVLQLAASPGHPELRSVITGLPVAAYDGSLGDRFAGSPGRGIVRAKTGTLRGTSALAGLTTDARGRVLVFAFLSNHVPDGDTLEAEAALDRLASALATCRC